MNEKGRLMKLESIRGFAALYVAIGHTFSKHLKIGGIDFSFLLSFGQEVVILFFFLSGFVIQYTFEKSKDKSFKTYFFKRFLRIYIPLLLIFLLNYAVQILQAGEKSGIDFFNLIFNLLMLQDTSGLKPNVVSETFLGNFPLWSLSYEWWFYMLFYLMVRLFKSRASTVVYGVGILAAASYLFYPFVANRILMYLVLWWVGADMAKLYLNRMEMSIRNLRMPIIGLFSVAAVLLLNVLINRDDVYEELHVRGLGISPFLELRHFCFGIVAMSSALFWNRYNWRFFSNTVGLFTPFASISFALYISHYFIVSTATYLDFIANPLLRYCCYFSICVLVSYVIERIIYTRMNKMFFASAFLKRKVVS